MPPVKTDGDSDGDGDLSGAESERSGSSQGQDHDSSAEEADEPDSDDSSEMSEGECERRRTNCQDNLTSLEKQFAILKEQLYKERMVQVDHKLQQIRGGRLQDYFVPLQQLQTNMDSRKEVAEVMKKYRVNNVKNKYEGELQACYQHFESEKNLAIDAISDELMEKVRRLEEDRHNVDISWADWGTSTRTAKVRGPGRKKAVTVSGPYIVYMLREEEILDDWTAIRKALKRSTAAAT
ncbi:breast cancer metastasis-suppressor 1-like protein [Anopheles arabiensis]|uniref:AGAP002712-PA n=7 Tax=gambiae species complex TaxID=44542 RepID=Q7QCM6_ANOGA|nr:breast cancer metastasis-suppressor 1-like protein [Anopheles arabiensis]XP_040225568.1 breast cancer metastasis-suppressor 1-like protein [Anopheles coluzzii]XP_041765191.1 breast cancer metastasis-suppressor 1-like protein [Anopheles merus]XP_312215.3 breast cancer metastasis-suppressor 1-like protein [Anopheles gambiae]EAA08119.3 AGAP002712-PA [Anopheles gambiae str. PEST]